MIDNHVFSPLILSDVEHKLPISLISIAHELDCESQEKFSELIDLPRHVDSLGNIDQICSQILCGDSENILPIEWIYCIYTIHEWNKRNPEQSLILAEKLWGISIHNYFLLQVLFWRVALHYSSEISLVDSILEAYKTFQVKHFHRFVSQISIISYLQSESPASGIANLAFQEYISPRELFVKAKLPSWIQPIQDAFGEVTEIFCTIDNPAKHHSQWLIRCFDQMNHELQTRSVERLLLTLPKQTAGSLPDLIQWLREHYGPKGLSLSWHSLSEEARKNLREWIGAASYQDFSNLVDRILNKLPPDDKERTRLSRRKDFWSNYSDAFLRIRILIPGKTISYLNTQDFSSDIEILAHDGTDTEVCIFDFGEWFVIEFFRGGGSEIRLFPKGDLETILFNSNNLSVKQLRSLGGEVHDHVFLWQRFCVKWLGRKGIYPNKNIAYFEGLSPSHGYYDWKTNSLPEPSQEDQLEREEQLNHWHRHIASL